MKTFNSIKELKPYYNKNTNTYEFIEDGIRMDVEFKFNLNVISHIYARDITAYDIKAQDIDAWNIDAGNIDAGNINAVNIKAQDIDALDIKASDINAWDISYHGVCFAYHNISCTSIQGRRKNAKHFALDGEITIKSKEQPKKKVTLELTDEQLEKVKEMLK